MLTHGLCLPRNKILFFLVIEMVLTRVINQQRGDYTREFTFIEVQLEREEKN